MNPDGVVDGEVVLHVPSPVAEVVAERLQGRAHAGWRWGHQNRKYQEQA